MLRFQRFTKSLSAFLSLFLVGQIAVIPCTVAVVSGKATPDGRPLLWKNRDTSALPNKMAFIQGEKYSFIGLIHPADKGPTNVWAGINTEGLDEAVESIARVRPGGHYLADDLTLKMLRTDEFFDNELFDHSESCDPHQSLLERAHRKVGSLVAGFESPVPDKVQEDLRRYFYDACKCLEQS